MKYAYKLLSAVVLILVASMIVWMGDGQRQRTPRPADTALQTSLAGLLNEKAYYLNSYFFLPDEYWLQMKEVSFECFLLLFLSLLVSPVYVILLCTHETFPGLLPRKTQIVFT
jgi:hypothetical protein